MPKPILGANNSQYNSTCFSSEHTILILAPPYPVLPNYTHSTLEHSCEFCVKAGGASAKYIGYSFVVLDMVVLKPIFGMRTTPIHSGCVFQSAVGVISYTVLGKVVLKPISGNGTNHSHS